MTCCADCSASPQGHNNNNNNNNNSNNNLNHNHNQNQIIMRKLVQRPTSFAGNSDQGALSTIRATTGKEVKDNHYKYILHLTPTLQLAVTFLSFKIIIKIIIINHYNSYMAP